MNAMNDWTPLIEYANLLGDGKSIDIMINDLLANEKAGTQEKSLKAIIKAGGAPTFLRAAIFGLLAARAVADEFHV